MPKKIFPNSFLGIEPEYSKYKTSKFIIIPVPHEVSTSYGKGTKNGPAAILEASKQVETFDLELHQETYQKVGIFTHPNVKLSKLKATTYKVLKDKKIPIILGGEHSISSVAVNAAKARYPRLSVLQFDAHADLRNEYEGNKNSHACAMRRVLEICPAVQVGIRNISEEEWKFAQESGQINKIHLAQKLEETEKIVTQLHDHVYITFDVDVLDPAIMPSTGTPEPGGLLWYEALDILREVIRLKRVVGMDFVELAPIKGLIAPDFTVAKLIYRSIGYLSR